MHFATSQCNSTIHEKNYNICYDVRLQLLGTFVAFWLLCRLINTIEFHIAQYRCRQWEKERSERMKAHNDEQKKAQCDK